MTNDQVTADAVFAKVNEWRVSEDIEGDIAEAVYCEVEESDGGALDAAMAALDRVRRRLMEFECALLDLGCGARVLNKYQWQRRGIVIDVFHNWGSDLWSYSVHRRLLAGLPLVICSGIATQEEAFAQAKAWVDEHYGGGAG